MRQSNVFQQIILPYNRAFMQMPKLGGKLCSIAHSNGDCIAVAYPVAQCGFNSLPYCMPVVEDSSKAFLLFILHHNIRFNFTASFYRSFQNVHITGQNPVDVFFYKMEKRSEE